MILCFTIQNISSAYKILSNYKVAMIAEEITKLDACHQSFKLKIPRSLLASERSWRFNV